jgi:general secretion pathway protein K
LSSRKNDRDAGFAILLVVGAVALLALLFAGLAHEARTEARIARNLGETARARAIAEAGLSLAFFHLLGGEWRGDGTLRDVPYDGGQARVRIEDEGGKIDLVAAPDALIDNLLDRIGIEGEERAALVAAIAERRQEEARRAAKAAAEDDLAGVPHHPREPPFDALEALLPMDTTHLVERLKPYVTVYTHASTIDPLTAPELVLLSVPSMDAVVAAQILTARGASPKQPLPPVPVAAAPYLAANDTQTFRVYSEGITESGAASRIEAVAVPAGDPRHPFRFMLWRQGFATTVSR